MPQNAPYLRMNRKHFFRKKKFFPGSISNVHIIYICHLNIKYLEITGYLIPADEDNDVKHDSDYKKPLNDGESGATEPTPPLVEPVEGMILRKIPKHNKDLVFFISKLRRMKNVMPVQYEGNVVNDGVPIKK